MIRVPVMLSIRSIIGLQPSAPGALQLYGCGYLGERYCRCKKCQIFRMMCGRYTCSPTARNLSHHVSVHTEDGVMITSSSMQSIQEHSL
jgi:hypothetical protein